MSPRAPKICNEPGCTTLVAGESRCAKHYSRNKWGHKTGTNRTAKTGHKQRRERILRRDPLCQLGYAGICTGISTVCDHIVPLAAGGADSDANCQGVCEPCSNRKTSLEGHYIAGHNVPCPWPTQGANDARPSARRRDGQPNDAQASAPSKPGVPRAIWIG
jgi:5-methylcytosine-specific restriction enzyme A